MQPAIAELRKLFDADDSDEVLKLRSLWTLQTLGAMPREELVALLDHPGEHLRVWGLRLLTDFWPIDTVHGRVRSSAEAIDPSLLPLLTKMAAEDPSGLVRLTLACTLQRMTPAEALKGATVLAARAIGLDGEVGSVEPGRRADLAVIDAPDPNHWLYHFRPNACRCTILGGRVVHEAVDA